jgi:diguanylate cyclase (GGDEF)-like protein
VAVALVLMAVFATRLNVLHERLQAQQRDLGLALEKVRTLTTTDSLTGTINRRHMMELMRSELIRHHRIGDPVCVALLEIDHFKRIDERFGKGAGDEVLRRFALHAGKVLRNTDLLARWNGEEFMVMLTHTPLDRAMIAMQRLRHHFRTVDLTDVAGNFTITFSIGLAAIRMNDGLDHAIDRADQSLFLARTGGKDRVECDNLVCA